MAAGTYTTKFQAGGSGDNIVPDGYIKTVEKVWIDSYTFSQTGTNTTIDIAVLDQNKKITGVDVYIYTTVTQTNGTVSIGFSTDANVDSLLAPTNITHNATVTTIDLWSGGLQAQNLTTAAMFGTLSGFQLVTGGTQVTVSVKLNNWTMSTGTMKTIVRYT